MASYILARRNCFKRYYFSRAWFSSRSNGDITRNFETLGLQYNPEVKQEDIKTAYLKLAKRFHPDSVTEESNTEKFIEIRNAYSMCMQTVQSQQSNGQEKEIEAELDELDSVLGYRKFRQVQHRSFLTYDGVGTGNPSQRQKAYQQQRLDSALENVFQRKYQKAMANHEEKALSVCEKGKQKKGHGRWDLSQRKLTNTIERLADDLIQEAMARGDFDNIKGKGRPLDSTHDIAHHVDSTTYRLNKVLITSGYSPEWVTMSREITDAVNNLKQKISDSVKWSTNGKSLVDLYGDSQWKESLVKWEEEVTIINKKIARFNLMVPLVQQRGPCSLKKLISTIVENQPYVKSYS